VWVKVAAFVALLASNASADDRTELHVRPWIAPEIEGHDPILADGIRLRLRKINTTELWD